MDTHKQDKRVVVRCVDERYSSGRVRACLPAGYDITAPGASRALIRPTAQRDGILASILETKDLIERAGHGLAGIIIVDHFDESGQHGCLAYGQYETDDSRATHEANLRQAAQVLADTPPLSGVRIELKLHDIDAGVVHEVLLEEPAAV